MILFVYIFFAGWLTCMLAIIYSLVNKSRKRFKFFVREWVIFFYFEMIIILFLNPNQMVCLGLHREAGMMYWMAFTKGLPTIINGILHGYGKDFLALLLVPAIPALIAFWIGYREEQVRISK